MWEDNFWENKWVVLVRQRLPAESFQQNLPNTPVGLEKLFYKHFSIFKSSNFRYQTFLAVSGNLGGNVPVVDNVLSFPEHEMYPTTSLDENCIDFEFETDLNYYIDMRQIHLALKLRLVKDRGYETYNTDEVKKEIKEETEVDVERAVEVEEDEGASVPLITHVNNILHSIFANIEVYINNQKFTIQMDSVRTSLTFPTTSREPSLKTRRFWFARGTIMKIFLTTL